MANSVEPAKNLTFLMLPPGSLAVAVSVIVAGGVKLVPDALTLTIGACVLHVDGDRS